MGPILKPITINLIVKKDIRERLSLSLVTVLAVLSLGLTLVNLYDYRENIKVIKTYESRIKEISQLSEEKRKPGPKMDIQDQEREASIKDLDYLSALIQKHLFSLPMVLTEIENAKQDKIFILSLVFMDDTSGVTIKGESDHMDAVAKFILDMDIFFEIEVSRQEINESKKIVFELIARWTSAENDPKI
jgi:hypothetical protein